MNHQHPGGLRGPALLEALAAGQNLPTEGTAFVSVRDADKAGIVEVARRL